VGRSFGLKVAVVQSDGQQPVGRGIGPALEARDVLSVLQGARDAPRDLGERAVVLAGQLLELAGQAERGTGRIMAAQVLADGRAWHKFQAICEAQGGMRQPPTADHRRPVLAEGSGEVALIDNRRLAMVAKLAGAPEDKAAGVELHVRLGTLVAQGEPLYTVHAESPGELAYAFEYLEANGDIIRLDQA
jgi:thymidine phosphorylase